MAWSLEGHDDDDHGASGTPQEIPRKPVSPTSPYSDKGPKALISDHLLPTSEPVTPLPAPAPKALHSIWRRPWDICRILIGISLPWPFYALAIYVGHLDGRLLDDGQWAHLFTIMKLVSCHLRWGRSVR